MSVGTKVTMGKARYDEHLAAGMVTDRRDGTFEVAGETKRRVYRVIGHTDDLLRLEVIEEERFAGTDPDADFEVMAHGDL